MFFEWLSWRDFSSCVATQFPYSQRTYRLIHLCQILYNNFFSTYNHSYLIRYRTCFHFHLQMSAFVATNIFCAYRIVLLFIQILFNFMPSVNYRRMSIYSSVIRSNSNSLLFRIFRCCNDTANYLFLSIFDTYKLLPAVQIFQSKLLPRQAQFRRSGWRSMSTCRC